MTLFTSQKDSLQAKPAYVVLDSRHIVKIMLSKISHHLRPHDEEEVFAKLVDEVLQLISVRRDAELSLQYESMTIVHESYLSSEINSIVEFTRFMVEFGMALVYQLEEAGVYQNGRMFYSYHGRIGDAIVLANALSKQNDTEPNTTAVQV